MSKAATQHKYKIQDLVLSLLPRRHLIAIIGLLAAMTICVSLLPSEKTIEPSTGIPAQPLSVGLHPAIQENISSAETLAKTTIEEAAKKPRGPQWQEYQIQAGDSLSILFRRAGLNDRDIYDLSKKAPDAKNLKFIRPGQRMLFLVDNGKLLGLKHQLNRLDSLAFMRDEKNNFIAEKINLKPDTRIAFHQASITSSLYMAGKRASIPNSITMDMANIFGWDIDFALDIQKGDSFKLMYEELYLDGELIGTGKILAAEFTNVNKTYKAVRYTDADGNSGYFTPEGRGMQKAFLRSPIEFARISSHFSLSRKHPVLHIIRAHKGTDYAASRGTPIRATGNGKVILAGRKGGYGNCVMIQHGQGIVTLYGHMNGFAKGIRSGTKVDQGDVIGYVGSTGLASGPHLHYEFHVNGQVRNPVTVPLPKSQGIAKTEMARFTATTGPLLAKLDELQSAQFAMTDTSQNIH